MVGIWIKAFTGSRWDNVSNSMVCLAMAFFPFHFNFPFIDLDNIGLLMPILFCHHACLTRTQAKMSHPLSLLIDDCTSSDGGFDRRGTCEQIFGDFGIDQASGKHFRIVTRSGKCKCGNMPEQFG